MSVPVVNLQPLRQRLIKQIARMEQALDDVRQQLVAIDAVASNPAQLVVPGVVSPGSPNPKK